MSSERILIVEDEPVLARTLGTWLEHLGYTTHVAGTGEEAVAKVSEWDCDLVFLDYMLPGMNGLDVLRKIRETESDLPVLFMTSRGSIDNAVAAMSAGAQDYMVKPIELDAVAMKVTSALEVASLRREVTAIKREERKQAGFEHIAAESPLMRQVMETVRTVAESEAETVLLLGESGVGKNLIAKAIHYNSPRSDRPFTNITCTALPDNLLESELFGHEKGAFTDAKKGRKGLLELSDGGTVFLDEIGDMPLTLQAKLLGFLESRSFRRVGGTQEIQSNVRVIAATNQDLKTEVNEKRFRGDLYYRLNVIDINLPPLRERREDISVIANLIIKEFNTKFRKRVEGIEADAIQALMRFDWPGNVRELRNILERAVILTRNVRLKVSDFPSDLMNATPSPTTPVEQAVAERETASSSGESELFSEGFNLEEHERFLVKRAMEMADGNQSKAAALLGITRNQIVYRLKKFGS